MVEQYHRLNAHEFEQTRGDSEGDFVLSSSYSYSKPSLALPTFLSMSGTLWRAGKH